VLATTERAVVAGRAVVAAAAEPEMARATTETEAKAATRKRDEMVIKQA
jgi:hypothetical protein